MKYVVKEGVVTINGVDLSDHVKAVDVKQEAAKIDATGLNGNGAMEHVQGLKDEEFVFTFMNDFDPGTVDETLQPLYASGAEFTVLVRPFAGAVAADNPEYSCARSVLFTYHPLNGQVGALSESQVTISTNAGITRTT